MRLLASVDAHPALRGVASGVLERNHDPATVLTIGLWLLASLIGLQVADPLPLGLDYRMNYLFQDLQSPWADPVMVALALALDPQLTTMVLLAGLGWLAFNRRAGASAHWIGTVAATLVTAWALDQALASPPPAGDLQAVVDQQGFPSLETAFAAGA